MKENKRGNKLNNDLYAAISGLIEQGRNSVRTAVNSAMVFTYWSIGKLIIENEQQGEVRAEYGKAVLKELGQQLSDEFGKGFDVTNLRKMRQFYLICPKRDAVRLELSWTYYRLLIKVEREQARLWYIKETVREILLNLADAIVEQGMK